MNKPDQALNKDFFLLWQGQLVSQIGTHLFNVARIYYLTEVLKSGILVGSLLACCVFATLLISPFAGVLVDRSSRRQILINSDIFSGIVSIILAAVAFSAKNSTAIAAVLFISSISISVSNSFFNSAAFAFIPKIVPENQLRRANSLFSASSQLAQIFGQGLGGLLYGLLGAPVLFFMNGVSFLISGLLEFFIRKDAPPINSNSNSKKSTKKELGFALKYMFYEPGLKECLLFLTCLNFAFVPLFVIIPFFTQKILNGGAQTYGYFIGALSSGSVIGMLAVAKISNHKKAHIILTYSTLIFLPLSYFMLFLAENFLHLIGTFLILGFCSSTLSTLATTAIQKNTADLHRGKIGALMSTISNIFGPTAFLLSGIAVEASGQQLRIVFVILGVFLSLITIILLTYSRIFLSAITKNN